ncbi:AEC family transporter [Povalibacter sp.]|uniref:AEC family transporter n=1 Tax=Povalibacter sp. TaxID=1962978 RepID=UPI002F40D887
MSSLLLLVTCLLLGWLVARFAHPPATLAQSLNWWVLNVALPALVLHLVPQIRFDAHLWFLAASMWLVFLGSWAFFALLGRALHWSRARIGALTLVCGLGNTSFVGFPMIEALRGEEGLRLAVLADQAGCFTALAVGGTIVAALYSGHSVAPLTVARRVLLFPPFIALIVASVVGAMSGWPGAIDGILDRLGATLVPLALFSVGLQFQLHLGRKQIPAIGLGLSWKLLLAPAIVWGAGWLVGVGGPVLTIAVLESAMAPMISAAILASQNDLEPQLANTILGVGILLSFVTVPIANHLLG